MTKPSFNEQFFDLMNDLVEDRLSIEGTGQLEDILRGDAAMQQKYVDFLFVVGGLHRIRGEGRTSTDISGIEDYEGFGVRDSDSIVGSAFEPPISIELEAENSYPPFPAVLATHNPLPANFVGGPVFSYMVATVVLCAMLLSAWAYKITHVEEMVKGEGKPSIRLANDSEYKTVGYVSGLKDCVWANGSLITMVGASVPTGRNYELISGLMEINYTSGARVILEGPCEYTADSDVGGHLLLGKLVARVGKRGVRNEGRGMADAKPRAANPQPPVSSPSNFHSPLFTVSTPTAIVTDLGTEFGVSVDSSGNTASCVFEGAVRLRAVGGESQAGTVLQAGEYARVEKNNAKGRPWIVSNEQAGIRPTFARRVKQPPEVIDLLDIVAGGNGITGLRERGIDPTTGKQDTWPLSTTRKGGKEYHLVEWNKFVDGVFTPYIKSRIQNPDVQLDSAGHIFKNFADHKLMDGQWLSNNLSGKTIGAIWARAADCDPKTRTVNASNWMHQISNDRQYMPEGRGLLGLHANTGITFDLEAIRREYEGVRPALFRAVAGLADGPKKFEDLIGTADVWIFVDGQLVWKRMYLKNQDGLVDVDVKLDANAKFISVVTTNCKYGYACDYVVFGDPVLVMESTGNKDDE